MIHIREYRKGDEDRVFQILSQSLKQYDLTTDTSSTDLDILDINTSYILQGGTFKVLELDNVCIGTYGLFKISHSVCELRKMYLVPGYKGQGYGKLIMEDAIKTAIDLGFKKIILETNSCLFEAVRMYRRYGFKDFNPEHLSDRCDIGMELNI